MAEEAEAKPVEKKVMRERKPKAPKEKKPKAPKEKKPKQPKTAHPPYFEMIKEALLALQEKSGSSPYAIAKYMEEKHKAELPANFKKILAVQLKNCAAKGKLIKIRASYKLAEGSAAEKHVTKEKVPIIIMEKKTRSATAAKKAEPTVKPGKKVATKKAKIATPAKPKQPKSIRSSVARKAKKAAA